MIFYFSQHFNCSPMLKATSVEKAFSKTFLFSNTSTHPKARNAPRLLGSDSDLDVIVSL